MGRGRKEEGTPAPELCKELPAKGLCVEQIRSPRPCLTWRYLLFPGFLISLSLCTGQIKGPGSCLASGPCGGMRCWVCREGSLGIPPPWSSSLPSLLRPPSPAPQWLLVGSDISDACGKGRAGLGHFDWDDPLPPSWVREEVLAGMAAPLLQPGLLPGSSGASHRGAGHGGLANCG